MKDWSRKPYRVKMSYPEMIRYTPARAFWNSITSSAPVLSEYGSGGKKLTALERRFLNFLKQSEAKKPYLSDDYESMEEIFEGFPGLIDNNPHIDHPWMPDPQPIRVTSGGIPGLSSWILNAFSEGVWCPGETKEITVNGTHPIYAIEFKWPIAIQPGTGFSITSGLGTPNVVISLTAAAGETGSIPMRAYLEAFDALPPPSQQGRGWTDFQVYEGSVSECKCAPPLPALTEGINPSTIAPSSSIVVSIVGGVTPYAWSVSGTGFSLTNPTTVGLSNTLNSDVSSCGTATITVTDFCGQTVEIQIRSTVGNWVLKNVGSCILPGYPTSYIGALFFEYLNGGKRQQQAYNTCYHSGISSCASTPFFACGNNLACSLVNAPPTGPQCVTLVCSWIQPYLVGAWPCCSSTGPPFCGVYNNLALFYYEWEC